jgi:hypothetical protein
LDLNAACDGPWTDLAQWQKDLFADTAWNSSECADGLICDSVSSRCVSGACDPTLERNAECGEGLVCSEFSLKCIRDPERSSAITVGVGAATIGTLIVGLGMPMLL